MESDTQPCFFIPHGGGPCFFMEDKAGVWTGMAAFLRTLGATSQRPKAIIVVSGHWETDGFFFTSAVRPTLLYDYYGFPPETYQLRYDVAGAPSLAEKAASLMQAAGLKSGLDPERGLDHGVFIPLKVAFPDEDIPVIEMSVDRSLDPALHVAAGKALSALRDEGVLILGSGMSFHNMRGYGDPRSTEPSQAFDAWLKATVESNAAARENALEKWADAPGGRFSHPREEHLIPLMVVSGMSQTAGACIYSEIVLETAISGFRFD